MSRGNWLPGVNVTRARSLRERFATGVAWNALCTIALQGGTFVTNLVVANLIGVDLYGQFGFLITTAQTVGTLMSLAAGMAATKFIAEHRHSQPSLAAAVLLFTHRLTMTTGAIGTVGLVVYALVGAEHSAAFAAIGGQLIVVAPLVFCYVLTGLQVGALAGLEGFRATAMVIWPLVLVQILSTALAAHFGGLNGALVATTANLCLRTFVLGRLLKRESTRAGLGECTDVAMHVRGMVMRFVLPTALLGLTYMPAVWMANAAIIGAGDGFAEAARFAAALTIRNMLMILPSILNGVGFTLLNSQLTLDRSDSFRRVLVANVVFCGVSAGLGAILVTGFGETILRAYGAGFVQAAPALQVLMLSLLAEALMWPLYQSLLSQRRGWLAVLLTQLPRDAIIAVFGVHWATEHGALGVAWAHAAGWGAALLGCVILVTLLPRTAAVQNR